MKNILIATDSFKESLTSEEVAEAITAGFKEINAEVTIDFVPIADGGEGTVDALVLASHGEIKELDVVGPMGKTVTAQYGISGDKQTAFIEMASASGIELVSPDERNPLTATTYGTGQLLKEAIESGVSEIIIGIGGSATNDAGLGMAQALGISCKDSVGNELGYGGAELARLSTIEIPSELTEKLANISIKVACDVDNPLTGANGASAIYGPQKGASQEDVEILDQALSHFATIVKEQLGITIDTIPGAGAAGGLGGGLVAFVGGKLESGITIVMNYLQIEKRLEGKDLVIVGEGKMDNQTLQGKAPVGVSRVAKQMGIPVIAIVGINQGDEHLLEENGITKVYQSMKEGQSVEYAMAHARQNIIDVVKQIEL